MDVVTTAAEGDYFIGVAALTNSLVRAGFAGEVIVACRGPRPGWIAALPTEGDGHRVAPSVRLRLVEVPGPWHLGNRRAHFIVDIFQRIQPAARVVYYFDTDIVVTGRWETLARWAQDGVVAALDVSDAFMPPNHAYRAEWRRMIARCGLPCREATGYLNSGCVGISRAHADFARVWARLMDGLAADGADMRSLRGTGKPEYARMDQDMMNVAAMAATTPMALLGFEAMGVYPRVGEIMPHAMFHKKPWRRPYLLDALRGMPPGRAHLAWWMFADGPLRPFGPWSLRWRKAHVAFARAVGLVHVRELRHL